MQTSKVLERDTQHQELAKLRLSQDNLNTTLQEQREELQRLTQHINTIEQQLNRVSLEAGLLTLVDLEAGLLTLVDSEAGLGDGTKQGSVVKEVPLLLTPAAPPPPPLPTHTHTHTLAATSV